MVWDAMEREAVTGGVATPFACHGCGAVLTVPGGRSAVSGPCPLCGEWLISPGDPRGEEGGKSSGFVSRRPPLREVKREPLPPLRPEGRVDWRLRRERSARLVAWVERMQARLCVSALLVASVILAFLHSHGWNLPWNLPEDSAVMRFFDGWGFSDDGSGLPTGPVRRR
jgi:predicted RNA-binding Zn-ribbon protein involved in translation (DUF1610 family)